jgi:hypothetical protein
MSPDGPLVSANGLRATDSTVKSRFWRRGFFFYFPSGVREEHGVLKSHVSLLAWKIMSGLASGTAQFGKFLAEPFGLRLCDNPLDATQHTTGGNTCFWSETRNSGLLREEALLDNQVPVEVAIAWITV